MFGFAFSQFCQNQKKSLESTLLHEKLIAINAMQPLDWQAANFLLKAQPNPSYEELFLASFLFAASRLGHLCIRQVGALEPAVEEIWPIEDMELIELCKPCLAKGYELLNDDKLIGNEFVVRKNDHLYLQKNYFFETEILKLFQELELKKPELQIEKLSLPDSLTLEQKQAIIGSFSHCLSFIIGGPGVGKTYVAHKLIEAFLKAFPKALVSIAAPTGKAVANLQEKFQKSEIQQQLHPMTLHKLFFKKIHSYLPYDLILIDESSMIDAAFFLKLLQYTKPNSRLIFLGDPNQLPPIGMGTLFKDLLEKSDACFFLTNCHRTEIKDILSCAETVQKGDIEVFLNMYFDKKCKNLTSPRQLVLQLLDRMAKITATMSNLEKLKEFQRYKILTSHKRGEYGSDALNSLFKQLLKERPDHPILITQNDYHLELFNGDQGFINAKGEAIFLSRTSQQSYFSEKESVRKIPLSLISSFEFSFCLSIHKSQGSEYEEISIVIPPSSEVFGRELLYTAITRAKKEFEIFSDKHTLTNLIKNTTNRLSGLR